MGMGGARLLSPGLEGAQLGGLARRLALQGHRPALQRGLLLRQRAAPGRKRGCQIQG